MQTPNTQGLLRQANPAWPLPTRTPRIRAENSRQEMELPTPPLLLLLPVHFANILNVQDALPPDDDLVVVVEVMALAFIVGFSILVFNVVVVVVVGIFSRWFRC